MTIASLPCVRAGTLMAEAESGTIDPADALVLESHVAACEDCRAARGRLGALGALMREPGDAPLAEALLSRAIDRALVARPAARAPRRSAAPWILAAAAAAAVALLAWPRAPRAPRGPGLARGEREIRLPGVRVVAEPGAAVRAVDGHGAIALTSGRVRVSVTKGTPFVVRTSRFEAVVAGTRFAVTTGGVEVWEGRVVVRAPDGTALARLGPSQSYRVPPATAPPAPAVAAVGPATASPRVAARRPAPTLRDVQQALRERRTDDARAMIDAMRPGAGEAATLALLRADSLRLDRRWVEAADLYREVADRWATSPVAETALFSQVQVLAERAPARARRPIDEYRRRYPRGRFLHEVDELSRRVP